MGFFKPDEEVIYNSLPLTEPKFVNAKATVDSVTISKSRVVYSISVKEQKGVYFTTHIIKDVPHSTLTFSGIPKEGDRVRDKFTGQYYTLSYYVYTPELYVLTRTDNSEKMTAISKKNFSHYFDIVKTVF